MLPMKPLDEVQKLDGPDYVTVVLEWTDADDEAPTMVSHRAWAPPERPWLTVLGALGAIALTTWGLRLLKPA